MLRLENTIQNYAWGSRSAIANLLGGPSPSAEPQAELWMGAHPKAPSLVLPTRESLAALIAREPEATLGGALSERFGQRLPFLFKVLAAETPLSLQAHPSLEQARAGFDAEQIRGIPLAAPERNYRDRNHKPELLCALTPFEALCGFRAIRDSLDLFRTLAAPHVSSLIDILDHLPTASGVSRLLSTLLSLPVEHRAELARETLERCSLLAGEEGTFQREFSWAARIGVLYPGDIGIVSALLLNLVQLAPGEAIYLPAGNLHAYLSGMGMEIMANSDNVLRGGLTPKHVDAPELLRVLDFSSGPPTVLQGELRGSARVYQTPSAEFELQSFRIAPGEQPAVTERRGPEILFCERGTISIQCGAQMLTLARGQSIFIMSAEPSYALSGEGTLFRASVGRG